MTKLLILPGSARRDSVNRKLAGLAAQIATEAGAEVDLIDPADFELPLFNGDLEDVFVSPEYNSSITPLMKNYIDWVSRQETDDEPALAAYRGKVAGLLSASPGALGGLRGLVHLRSILGNIGVLVVPKQFALSGAYGKFDDSGKLTDESAVKSVRGVIQEVISTATKLG